MKPFTMVAMVVLALVSLLQLMRFTMGWDVSVNGAMIPFWASLVPCVVAGTLAWGMWRESHFV